MQYLDRFLALKKKNTRRAYLTAILHWESYIDSSLDSRTEHDALKYLCDYRQIRSDVSTSHRYAILKTYHQFMVDLRVADRNPFNQIKTLVRFNNPNQVRPTKTLDIETIKKIISSIDVSSYLGLRQISFIGLLFGGGLRRGEVVRISRCNVKFEPISGACYVILENSKNGEPINQPIPKWVATNIKTLLEYNERMGVGIKEPILGLTYDSAYTMFKNICAKVGIYDAAPHSMRAAAATYMKECGEEDRSVAEFLRHKTTTMVQVYDHRARKYKATPKKCLENIF